METDEQHQDRRRAVDPLIVRIDERTKRIQEELKELRETVVSRAEFNPVKVLVYGIVGLILSAVFAALVAQVVITR